MSETQAEPTTGTDAQAAAPLDDGGDELWAIPVVSIETGDPHVTLTWGSMSGTLEPEHARLLGISIVEAAETAEVESVLFAWLLKDATGNRDGVARILEAFRAFRARHAADRAGDVEDRSPGEA